MLSSDCPLGVLCPCIIEKIKEMYAICRPRVILTGERKNRLEIGTIPCVLSAENVVGNWLSATTRK